MKTAEINWTQGKHGGLYITRDGAGYLVHITKKKKHIYKEYFKNFIMMYVTS